MLAATDLSETSRDTTYHPVRDLIVTASSLAARIKLHMTVARLHVAKT